MLAEQCAGHRCLVECSRGRKATMTCKCNIKQVPLFNLVWRWQATPCPADAESPQALPMLQAVQDVSVCMVVLRSTGSLVCSVTVGGTTVHTSCKGKSTVVHTTPKRSAFVKGGPVKVSCGKWLPWHVLLFDC
jgi:hypothetical protein